MNGFRNEEPIRYQDAVTSSAQLMANWRWEFPVIGEVPFCTTVPLAERWLRCINDISYCRHIENRRKKGLGSSNDEAAPVDEIADS